MKKFNFIILTVITIILLIGMFHSKYGNIIGKILLFWALFLAVYSNLTNKKKIHD
jgi:hypothetical protein